MNCRYDFRPRSELSLFVFPKQLNIFFSPSCGRGIWTLPKGAPMASPQAAVRSGWFLT